MTFIETFASIYWAAQKKRLRGFRTMPAELRPQAALVAQGLGDVVDIAIMVYGWDPIQVMADRLVTGGEPGIITSVDPKDFPRAADLMLSAPPFTPQYPNRRGDPETHIGDAWYAPVGDTSDIGSQVSGTGVYQKVLGVAQPGPTPTYYADWSLTGMIPFWVRIG